ncbi:Actin-binding FH2 protein isoform 1 [Hibiscus syriacus]|uniref:Actin-binding FH2 protein isoform 1 n=1 Tax=Hibiscus syriacus TaxID=106335 RepID=A0A6A3CUG1_HIBSY|nr:Actin-binding FH2 protein isoform 1 [Hibiscus syriacus]
MPLSPTLTALALAVPGNLALAAIEALFHYRVASRAYGGGGDFNGFSMAMEGVLIAYLYSIFVVLDTVVGSTFFKSCKTGCLVDREGRYCYKIEIVAEKDGNAYVKLKNIEEFP